jgi:ABC-type transport system involved in cytochrome c biogenesis permease subunit
MSLVTITGPASIAITATSGILALAVLGYVGSARTGSPLLAAAAVVLLTLAGILGVLYVVSRHQGTRAVKPAGGKAMDAFSYANGRRLKAGDVLG